MSFMEKNVHCLSHMIVVVLLPLVALFCLIGLLSCVEIDKLIDQGPPRNFIRHKHYDKPPLPQSKLNELLQMSIYNGRPDRYGDLVMRGNKSMKGLGPVKFSHRIHRVKYTCRVCHIELEFSMKRGESGITREDNLDGRYCGACHNGKITFSTEFACDLCHISEKTLNTVYVDPTYEDLTAILPPSDSGDRIDWDRAIADGDIHPKSSLYEGQAATSMPLPPELEKPLQWYTNVPGVYVSFPHKEHIVWLDCSNCHPDIFMSEKSGTVEFDKEKNLYGMYCGVCHMTVAFPFNDCTRCHPGNSKRYKGSNIGQSN